MDSRMADIIWYAILAAMGLYGGWRIWSFAQANLSWMDFGEAVGSGVEASAKDDELGSAVAEGQFEALIDEAGAHQHEPNEAEDIGVVDGVVEVAIEGCADGVVGDEGGLRGTNEAVGGPIGVADTGIGLAGAEGSCGSGQDRGAGGESVGLHDALAPGEGEFLGALGVAV